MVIDKDYYVYLQDEDSSYGMEIEVVGDAVNYRCNTGSYEIDWGDGTHNSASNPSSINDRAANTHTFATPGAHWVLFPASTVFTGSYEDGTSSMSVERRYYNFYAAPIGTQQTTNNYHYTSQTTGDEYYIYNSYTYSTATSIKVRGTVICQRAFQDYAKYKTSYGGSAVYHYGSLQTVYIGKRIDSIRDYAFQGQTSLQTVYVANPTPPSMSDKHPFQTVRNGASTISTWPTVVVPYSSDHSILEAYKAAKGWRYVKNYIVEAS